MLKVNTRSIDKLVSTVESTMTVEIQKCVVPPIKVKIRSFQYGNYAHLSFKGYRHLLHLYVLTIFLYFHVVITVKYLKDNVKSAKLYVRSLQADIISDEGVNYHYNRPFRYKR